MGTYQLKLAMFFFNIFIKGDTSLEDDRDILQYHDCRLEKVGVPGKIKIGTSTSMLTVVTNNSESTDPESGELDPETLRTVEVIVDEAAERRGDAFFEYVMPIGAEGLSILDVVESDLVPIVNDEKVYIPVPWVGPSTIQLIAPDGFVKVPVDDYYVVESLLVVVSPEIPQS